MERKKLIAGNWKMNGLITDAQARINKLHNLIKNSHSKVDVLVCPPFTLLTTVKELCHNTNIMLGAQDCHFNESGAHTGDVSPIMLKDLSCKYVILGHSERRVDHNESNALVQKKVTAALKHGLIPILCIGESKEEKEKKVTLKVLQKQLAESLPKNAKNFVIAYEPIWAIGTSVTPTLEEIENTHQEIRNYLTTLIGNQANNIQILYGGSLKPSNAKEILALKNVDGGLIGGASLIAEDFFTIIASN